MKSTTVLRNACSSIDRRSALVLAGAAMGAMCIPSGLVALADTTDSTGHDEPHDGAAPVDIDAIVEGMSLDEKISQMIIPAVRTWDEQNMTDLSAAPDLAGALRRHQYCGVILFGANVATTEQVARLVSDLQANNAQIEGVATHIPYLMPLDEEGGVVTRLTTGTRMTGSMAVGATSDAAANARLTGRVIGEELASLGFNVDFAPSIDVNSDPSNPVIGTRSFSDDPQVVSELGIAFAEGLAQSNIVATYKHFPGHGDTGTDSHIDLASIDKPFDQYEADDLPPFRAAVETGADLVMTAHITFPAYDDEVVFGDGEKRGYYPATMSKKIMDGLLRGELGFDGVVVTDALEMGAIVDAALVPGEPGSAEYQANVAEKVIEAGVDILLLPHDLKDADAAAFYDEYIERLADKVDEGAIEAARIDQSVRRILSLKEKYGILQADVSGNDIEDVVLGALEQVGSDEHHEVEMGIAREAITLLKDDGVLPIVADGARIVFLGRQTDDGTAISYTISCLQEQGLIPADAHVVNAIDGSEAGGDGASCDIYIDYYYDIANAALRYTDELREAIAAADTVVCFVKTFNLAALQPESPQYQGVSSAIDDAHAAGAKFVLLSDNLPYDAARYQDADAIVLAYMGSGLDVDPTERRDGMRNAGAFNANVVAAMEMLFDGSEFKGKLPVNIPSLVESDDGTVAYSDEILYPRGYSL